MMTAAALRDLDAVPSRRARASARPPVAPHAPSAAAATPLHAAPHTGESLAARSHPGPVQVTVHLSFGSGALPPAAAGLLESLRALAAAGTVNAVVAGEPSAGGAEQAAPPRPRLLRPAPDPAQPEILVHPAARLVYRDGSLVRLTRREYDLFAFLCEHPRRVFTRHQLLRQVWGYEPVSGERTVDVHVRRLRSKLGGGPTSVVATVRGVGYRLGEAARIQRADTDA